MLAAQSSCPMVVVSAQHCLAKPQQGPHIDRKRWICVTREGGKAVAISTALQVFKSPEVWPHVVKGSLAWAVSGCVDSVSFLSSLLSLDRPERWDTNPTAHTQRKSLPN